MAFSTLFLGVVFLLPLAALGTPHSPKHPNRHHAHIAGSKRGPSLPAGWSSLGCYQDPSGNRLLSKQLYTANTNSIDTCVAQCATAGYKYAGGEYGVECWCGNSLNSPQTSTSCGMPCAGSSSQTCGGGNLISVYIKSGSSTPTSTSYTSLGCYTDQSARTLNGPNFVDQAMTNDLCSTKCAGYAYFGTEYGEECWCANSISSTTKATSCDKPCKGDGSKICGGGWSLSVFQRSSPSASASSSSSPSASSTPSSSSASTWTSVGCYADQEPRTLSVQSSDSKLTPAACQAKCKDYTYFGTENGNECWCGNTLASTKQASNCNVPCGGAASLTCGGSWALSVFKNPSSTTTTTTPTPSAGYTQVGCYRDSWNRVLSSGQGADTSKRTQQSCFDQCAAQGYCYAGLETGSECWCGSTIQKSSDSGNVLDASQCGTACTGNGGQKCGGGWALSIFYDGTKSKCSGPPGSSSPTSSSTSAAQSTPTPAPAPANGNWWVANGSPAPKVIVSHIILGNTYSYTPAQWTAEIKLASAQGIDAFALNFGYDSWQPNQLQSAYDAAASSGTGFKMFLSFDMLALSCSDDNVVVSNIAKFHNHPAQLKDSQGASWVSTFDGGWCRNNGQWQNIVKNQGIATRFIPAFFNDLTNSVMKQMFPVMNGDFLWGGAWPKGNNDIDWSEDNYRISRNGLGRPGDIYMTSVSPWFFVHYGGGRNYMLRGDNWLYNKRWELLVANRNLVDAVEIISWNDYGESTYIGPIGKDQPGSQAWVTGFDHTPFLKMTGYYASAFKTGSWPTIVADKIFIWGRPHPRDAGANDGLGRPDRYTWTEDKLWIVLFSTGNGSLRVTQGGSSSTTDVTAGVNKISMGLSPSPSVTAVLTRNGAQVFSFTGALSYTTNPPSYNYNINAIAGP